MWGPPEFLRSAALVIVVAGIAFAVTHTGSHFEPPVVEAHPIPANPASDNLSAELRRCRTLGAQDPVDGRCVAVWEENRRRFFGARAQPLPSANAAAPAASTPALSTPGVAR